MSNKRSGNKKTIRKSGAIVIAGASIAANLACQGHELENKECEAPWWKKQVCDWNIDEPPKEIVTDNDYWPPYLSTSTYTSTVSVSPSAAPSTSTTI